MPFLSHLRLRLHLSLDGILHTASLLRCIMKGAVLLQIPRRWQRLGVIDWQSSDGTARIDAMASSLLKPRR